MKKLLLFLAVIPVLGQAQSIQSIANGNFYNPMTWSCFCIPSNGDSLVINHSVVLDYDLYYTAGQIKINTIGSLTGSSPLRAVWLDGNGSMINNGSYSSHHFYTSNSSWLQNTGSFTVDSLLIQTNVVNSGTLSAYDLMNDENATLTNYGNITVTNDMNNQGDYRNQSEGQISVTRDFSNCNTQSLNAVFTNHGIMCVGRDFANCEDDTLKGTGHFYVGRHGFNAGVFDETITFNVLPQNDFLSIGVINAGVNMLDGSCILSTDEQLLNDFTIWPNPAHEVLNLSLTDSPYQIFDFTGKIVQQATVSMYRISLDNLSTGMYLLRIDGHGTQRFVVE